MPAAAFKGNLIITNLPSDMTGTRLAELFDRFGMVIGAEIRSIPAMAGTATIGVVALAPEEAVDRAIEAVNLTLIDERRVRVGRARQRPPKSKGVTAPSNAAVSPGRAMASPTLATQSTQPPRTLIVEYKPRRRLISNA
jgi:RNA recognition motif-containing protein